MVRAEGIACFGAEGLECGRFGLRLEGTMGLVVLGGRGWYCDGESKICGVMNWYVGEGEEVGCDRRYGECGIVE